MESLGKYKHAKSWTDYHYPHLVPSPNANAIWFGRGASLLDLSGAVSIEGADNIFSNKHPTSKESLRKRPGAIAVFELVYSVPKSVSIVALYDDRIESMVLKAAQAALRFVERHASTRERTGPDHATNAVSPTANIVAALVPNLSSRAGDPQLHVHCAIANITFDGADACWTALQAGWIFDPKNRHLADLIAHNELAKLLISAGYDVVLTDVAFEIRGIGSSLLAAFSTRRCEVLESTNQLRVELAELQATENRTDKESKRLAFLSSMDDRTMRHYAARISREPKSEPSVAEIRQRFETKVEREALGVGPLKLLAIQAKSTNGERTSVEATQSDLISSALAYLDTQKVATKQDLALIVFAAHLGKTSLGAVELALESSDFMPIRESGHGVLTTQAHLFTLSKASQALAEFNGTEVPLRLLKPHRPDQISEETKVVFNHTGIWLIISSRNCTSRSLRNELEAKLGLGHAVVVRPATELLGAIFKFNGRSRTVFVADEPISAALEAMIAYLEARGALRHWFPNLEVEQLTMRQLAPEVAEQEIVRDFLAAKRKRGRFPQILAATADGAAAFAKKVRQALFPDTATETYVAGDQVRATGSNRLGESRTERHRLYHVTQVSTEGALVLNGRLRVPPDFVFLEPGYAVADPAQVAPNAGLILIGPGVTPAVIDKVKSQRPKATIVVFAKLGALVPTFVHRLWKKRRRKIVHAVAYESLLTDLTTPAVEISVPGKSINSTQQHHEHHQDKPAREPLLR